MHRTSFQPHRARQWCWIAAVAMPFLNFPTHACFCGNRCLSGAPASRSCCSGRAACCNKTCCRARQQGLGTAQLRVDRKCPIIAGDDTSACRCRISPDSMMLRPGDDLKRIIENLAPTDWACVRMTSPADFTLTRNATRIRVRSSGLTALECCIVLCRLTL